MTPPPPPKVGSSHESVVFAWSMSLAGAVASVLKLAAETPSLNADVRLLLRQAQNDLERGVANCETAERRSIVSRRPHLAPMWPRNPTDLSTTEVQVRTTVRSPLTPTLISPETVDWMTGAPCTVTRDEYAGAVRA